MAGDKKQIWKVIENRWSKEGIFSQPSDFVDKDKLYEFARNDIQDLIDYIKEIEEFTKTKIYL